MATSPLTHRSLFASLFGVLATAVIGKPVDKLRWWRRPANGVVTFKLKVLPDPHFASTVDEITEAMKAEMNRREKELAAKIDELRQQFNNEQRDFCI